MIRSTFAGFNTAQLAMMASQRGLDVTGQNLSNINTTGYTRQRLDLLSLNPVGNSIGSSAFDAKVGQGVMMRGVSQIRDPFLDIQYRGEVPKVGTVKAKDDILASIGNIFDESDSEAIRTRLSAIVSQLTNLATPENAGSGSADALVRSACEVLLDSLHQNGSAIANVRTELINKMDQSVMPQLKTYLEEIKNLNISIRNSQILGNPALELQDQRNQMLDELAEYMPIEVSYHTKEMGGGIKVDTLEVKLKLSNGNKVSLINDSERGEFEFTFDAKTNKGVLKATAAKDPDDPNAPAPTKQLVTDLLSNGILKGNLDMLNKSEAFDHPASDTKGIGYYEQTFNMFVNEFAMMMNKLNSDAKDGSINKPLFTTTDGKTEGFTATNIKLSDQWINGETKITLSKKQDAGSTDYENVLKMINALSSDMITFKTQPKKADGTGATDAKGDPIEKQIFKGTFFECYNNIQNTQALERQSTTSLLKNHQTVADQVADSRESVSGVNMDEEVMDLMRFSQSYNAASRLMTTMDELLERLITNTGVVGR